MPCRSATPVLSAAKKRHEITAAELGALLSGIDLSHAPFGAAGFVRRRDRNPAQLQSGPASIIKPEHAMSIEEAILEKVRALPPDKQSALLAVADSLSAEPQTKAPLRSPKGLWADFDIDISEADIAALRLEMWKDFPRDV